MDQTRVAENIFESKPESRGIARRHRLRWLDGVEQWYSTWGTRTPGGTRRHLRGYVK
jgi:hypothetical protein